MAVESYAMTTDNKEVFAEWMRRHEYATGHGDTIEDLLEELKWQIAERCERAVAAEREACLTILQNLKLSRIGVSDAIQARGQE
jgi:hypothetical protein